MRIVITGGAGFIGSHVVDGALAAGYQVCVLDDLSTGNRSQVAPASELIVGDVRDSDLVHQIFADFKPDIVCHHAAQVSVPQSLEDPAHDLSVNALGTLSILQSAQRHKVQVVYASSGGAIYGEVPHASCASIETIANPSTPYGCSKLAGEFYVQSYGINFGLPFTILRYSNVYGPRQNSEGEGGVVAIFVKHFLLGKNVSVYAQDQAGDAGCIRDYVYVADVVQANLAAFRREIEQPIVNISTGVETTTQALAHLLQELTANKTSIRYEKSRPGDVKRSVLVPSSLNYSLTSLRQGLERTVEWGRSAYHL